ncbi:hypothetical protein L228DRAFT_167278 [Xylona heveae TC161]|uniref:Uncharacterized protein n=1 Tax=Xylona heveae (strain CBS 132557 / TC161) TaxID=1328760 RepID=A0A165FMC9_XYLHT|nr:hypothetical protein L228DRAFT_167278 [Xylona heveae TC161]KZF21152.1 hypothetical protein L228DRAFT_167278 [Xylona heveae TC161]
MYSSRQSMPHPCRISRLDQNFMCSPRKEADVHPVLFTFLFFICCPFILCHQQAGVIAIPLIGLNPLVAPRAWTWRSLPCLSARVHWLLIFVYPYILEQALRVLPVPFVAKATQHCELPGLAGCFHSMYMYV